MDLTTRPPRISLLITAAMFLAILPAQAQQSGVPDSIAMELKTYYYTYGPGEFDQIYYNCGAGIYATWPNDALKWNPNADYSTYELVATEGETVPGGKGSPDSGREATTDPRTQIIVPDGYLGHNPILGAGAQGGSSEGYAICADYLSSVQELLGGKQSGLNAHPFRITKWYAVHTPPDGIAIAGFDSKQTEGLTVAFNGAFPKSREIDALVPLGRRPVQTYEWDFGGLGTSSSAAPSFTFPEPGIYTVALTVTDDDGDTDTEVKQVEVSGVILEYSTEIVQKVVGTTESFTVIAKVTNVGNEAAKNVRIQPSFSFAVDYLGAGEEPDVRDGIRTSPSLPLDDKIFQALEPGESKEAIQIYGVQKNAELDDNGVWVPIDVEWTANVVKVSGTDQAGKSAVIVNKCPEKGICPNTTKVTPVQLSAEIVLTTNTGPATVVPSGHKRRRTLVGNNVQIQHLDPLSAKCVSGCFEIEVTVTDPDSNPKEGAVVELTSRDPVTLQGIVGVSVLQGNGLFCSETASPTCGPTLLLAPTDADGKATARFWFPGVSRDKLITIIANARAENVGGTAVETHTRLGANVVDFGAPNALPIAIEAQALGLGAEIGQTLNASKVAEWCRVLPAIRLKSTKRPISNDLLRALDNGIARVCGGLLSRYEGLIANNLFFADEARQLFEASEALADVAGLVWLLKDTDHSLNGVVSNEQSLLDAPFYTYEGEFAEVLIETMRLFATQIFEVGPSQIYQFRVNEVSYRDRFTDFTPALFLELNSTGPGSFQRNAYISKEYVPDVWLKWDDNKQSKITAAAQISDEELSVNLNGRANGKRSSAPAPTYFAGQLLKLNVGASEEVVQIASVTDSILTLTTPLRSAHSVGVDVYLIDSLAVGTPPPAVPVAFADNRPGAPDTPMLEWLSPAPAMSYTVEVATDSLFATIVQTHSDLVDASIVLDQLDDQTQYFWRVSATNLLGTGDWSPTFSFYTGAPLGDNLADAFDLQGSAPVSRVQWNVSTTAEPSEVASSCGTDDDNSLWFSFTPTETKTYAVETFESGFNTTVSVWTGTAHPLSEVACNDDYSSGPNQDTNRSYAEFEGTSGTTYFIRVAGSEADEGLAVLRLRGPSLVGTENPSDPISDSYILDVYPNPVMHSATVTFSQATSGSTEIDLYDSLGRRTLSIVDAELGSGLSTYSLAMDKLPAGVYFLRATVGSRVVTRSITVVR